MFQRLVDKIVFFFRVLGYGRTAILKIHITKIERISFGLFYGTLHYEKLERLQGLIDYSKAKKISIQQILSLPSKSFILFNLMHFPHSYLQSLFASMPEMWEHLSEYDIDAVYKKCYGLEGKMSMTAFLFNHTDWDPFYIIIDGGQTTAWKITLIEQYLDFHIDFLKFNAVNKAGDLTLDKVKKGKTKHESKESLRNYLEEQLSRLKMDL